MSERTVLLYGQSLLLSLVAANLTHSDRLYVIRATTWAQVEGLLADRTPDVLICDLAGTAESHILPLLLEHPGLLLIGLDPETNRAILLTGQEAHALTLERMQEIVEAASEG